MRHLPAVLKIVEGGMQRDTLKVSRYASHLAEKLELEGDVSSADLLRKTAARLEQKAIHTARQTPAAPGRAPVDAESRMALADISWPKLDDFALVYADATAAEISTFIQSHLRREELMKAGLKAPGHLLLFGPPGCGKTQTAQYIAARLAMPLVTARVDSLVSSYLGSTAKNLRMLFDYVDQTPCVLLLDEFDAIAKMRDDPHELGELKRVVNSLLQNMDSLPDGVVVIAATNHAQLLDSAVWRRFEFHVALGLPAETERGRLLQRLMPEFVGNPALLSGLAALAEGLTPAQIVRAVELASRRAVLGGSVGPAISDVAALLATSPRGSTGTEQRSWPSSINEQIRFLRGLADSVFTYEVISQMVGVSKGKISNVLNEKGSDGRRTPTH